MRGRWSNPVVVVALAFGACGGGSGAADDEHDEFSASFLARFPNLVEVHPGDRVDVKQAWTIEPSRKLRGPIFERVKFAKPPEEEADAGPPEGARELVGKVVVR